MGLETGTTISQLVSTNPLGSDLRSQGDDHLRLIKAVLKAQFPGVGGLGFNIPITAKETELNFLAGVTSNIQAQINAAKTILYAPTGTRIVFYSASPPTGWTVVAGLTNRLLVFAGGGALGGNAAHNVVTGCNVVASHVHTDTFAATTNTVVHNHDYITGIPNTGAAGSVNATGQQTATTTNNSHSHTVTITGSVQANTGADIWQPIYATVIVGNKT